MKHCTSTSFKIQVFCAAFAVVWLVSIATATHAVRTFHQQAKRQSALLEAQAQLQPNLDFLNQMREALNNLVISFESGSTRSHSNQTLPSLLPPSQSPPPTILTQSTLSPHPLTPLTIQTSSVEWQQTSLKEIETLVNAANSLSPPIRLSALSITPLSSTDPTRVKAKATFITFSAIN